MTRAKVQQAVIRNAADALAVIDRALTTIEYMIANPAQCEETRARLAKDRVTLVEVIDWVQDRFAESWSVKAHLKKEAEALRWTQDSEGAWQCGVGQVSERRTSCDESSAACSP